ncbi:MAG: site-2 protease family protein [Candidatus Hydrothermarchaeota archaeon]
MLKTINFSASLFYLLVSFVLSFFVHEAGHIIVASIENVKIKNFKLFWKGFGIEFDEKSFDNADMLTILKIYSAGPTFNLLFSILANVFSNILNSGFLGCFAFVSLMFYLISSLISKETDGFHIAYRLSFSEYSTKFGYSLGISIFMTPIMVFLLLIFY